LDEADAYVVRNGINLPEEPDAHKIDPNPKCVTHPILELNLAADGIIPTAFRSDSLAISLSMVS